MEDSDHLYRNNGDGTFTDVTIKSGLLSFGLSLSATVSDLNQDGLKDIYISNDIFHEVTSLDFTDFISDKNNIDQVVMKSGQFDWRDFAVMLSSNALANYAFINGLGESENQGSGWIPTFTNQADQLGLGDPGFSNGAAYGDLDNDGDLDLVTNNVNMEAFVYRNNSSNN